MLYPKFQDYLVSVAEQVGLSLTWSQTTEDRFSHDVAQKIQAFKINLHTVMFLSFRTDMPGQTVQTQIRLLLAELSDQGLHCLPFRLHRLDSLLYGRAT